MPVFSCRHRIFLKISDQAAFLRQDDCCVLDLDREIICVHTAADLHQAAGAVDSDERSACIFDVLNLLAQDRCCDLRKLDAVCAAETAADIGLFHLDQVDALCCLEEFSLLLEDAQLSLEVAGIMIGDGKRCLIACLCQSAQIIEELAEVEGLAAQFLCLLVHLGAFLKEVFIDAQLVCAGRACGYDIIVIFRVHCLDVELSGLLGVLAVTHEGSGSAAAGLTHRHVNNVADGVEVRNDSLGDVYISEVKQTSGEHSDPALGIVDLLLDGREDISERHGSNAHQASALCHAGP